MALAVCHSRGVQRGMGRIKGARKGARGLLGRLYRGGVILTGAFAFSTAWFVSTLGAGFLGRHWMAAQFVGWVAGSGFAWLLWLLVGPLRGSAAYPANAAYPRKQDS